MLNKLKSRHDLDLPLEEWKPSRGLRVVLGGMVVLFVLLPALGAVALGLVETPVAVAVGLLSGLAGLLVAAVVYRRYRAAA